MTMKLTDAARALWLVGAVALFVLCCAPHAYAVEIRWQHPAGDPRPYDSASLCDSARCIALR